MLSLSDLRVAAREPAADGASGVDTPPRSPAPVHSPATSADETHSTMQQAMVVDPFDARTTFAEVRRRLFGSPDPARLGRYVVLERLGHGGAGIVHAAYDPQLDRKVALKLLYHSGGPMPRDGLHRLLQEAQAIARLSHPNVVAVYDTGTVGPLDDLGHDIDTVYIVMEFIDGLTLAAWLRQQRRAWRDIVRVFVAAGRGLAHAHRQGFVHRDFKPSNVMVDKHGAVKVLDFGLAQPAVANPTKLPPTSATANCSRPGPLLSTLVGTPEYMAPERFDGQGASEATDQYAFCCALFEALTGHRPYLGSAVEIRAKQAHGTAVCEPALSHVPRWLRAAVLRGLATEPRQRHASLDDLLAVLERKRTRRWFHAAAAAALGCSVAAIVYAGHTQQQARELMCSDDIQAASESWGPTNKARTRAAFLATNQPFAQRAWETVEHAIDKHVEQHIRRRRSACIDHRAESGPTSAPADQAQVCLDRQLVRTRQLIAMFEQADAAIVENATQAVSRLPDPRECGHDEANDTTADPHEVRFDRLAVASTLATRPRLEQLLAVDAEIGAARSAYYVGKIDESAALAERALEHANQLDDAESLARAYLALGDARRWQGHTEVAEQLLRQSLLAAERAGDTEQAVAALIELAWVVGDLLARHDEGVGFAEIARARLAGMGGNDGLEAHLAVAHGRALERAGRYVEAQAVLESGLQAAQRVFGSRHPVVGELYNIIGITFDRRGDTHQALAWYRRALELRIDLLGKGHPRVANATANVGIMLGASGRPEDGIPMLVRALDLYQQGLSPEHASVGWTTANLGTLLLWADRPEEALVYHEDALEILARARGADHPHTARQTGRVADALLALDRAPQALPLAERAVAALHGSRTPDLGFVLQIRGRVRHALGDFGGAQSDYEATLASWSESLGDDSPRRALVWRDMALTHAALGETDQAQSLLERAANQLLAHRQSERDLASVQFALAKLLVGRDDKRALELAVAARDGHLAAQQPRATARVDAWLEQTGDGQP